MSLEEIKELVLLITAIISLIVSIVTIISSAVKNNLSAFVREKMQEAEASGLTGSQKLEFVLEAVKEKYKFKQLVNLAKELVEKLIEFSKKVNAK